MAVRINFIFILLLLFAQGCEVDKIELVNEVEKSYNENKRAYHFLIDYFKTTSDDIAGISIDHNGIWILNFTSVQPIIINSKEEIRDLKEIEDHEALIACVVLMEGLSLSSVSSMNDEATFMFNDSHLFNCYSFYYDKDFDPNDSFIANKITDFTKDKSTWIYIVDEQWYVEKTKCLN